MLALGRADRQRHAVATTGLARTRLLLADGCGPLYNRATRGSLKTELLAIDAALAAH